MEEEIQTTSVKSIVITIAISFFATALVVGGLVYFWQSSLVDEKQQSCDDQKEILMTQIQEMKTNVDEVEEEVVEVPEVEKMTLKGKSLQVYLDNYEDYTAVLPPGVEVDSVALERYSVYEAQDLTHEACPEVPEGPCGGTTFFLVGRKADLTVDDLNDTEEFYLFRSNATGSLLFYGPFEDDLKSLIDEAKGLK